MYITLLILLITGYEVVLVGALWCYSVKNKQPHLNYIIMRTKEQMLQDYVKERSLLPVGTRVIITYPKCDHFGRVGTIIAHCEKNGSFFWDYTIRLGKDLIVYKDKELVEKV